METPLMRSFNSMFARLHVCVYKSLQHPLHRRLSDVYNNDAKLSFLSVISPVTLSENDERWCFVQLILCRVSRTILTWTPQ